MGGQASISNVKEQLHMKLINSQYNTCGTSSSTSHGHILSPRQFVARKKSDLCLALHKTLTKCRLIIISNLTCPPARLESVGFSKFDLNVCTSIFAIFRKVTSSSLSFGRVFKSYKKQVGLTLG